LGAAFSGRTAAWLHGLDLAPTDPIEATIPIPSRTATLSGVTARRTSLPESDVVVRRGLPTTSALRTVVDIGSRPPFVEAVVAVEMDCVAGSLAFLKFASGLQGTLDQRVLSNFGASSSWPSR
jgi:hypothetical protein